MGDFTGFSFGNWHSTDPDTGVIVHRVSGGDRYDEQLHPEIKDKTAEVPGLNGEYYFGSDFGPRTFDIEIAFDSLDEYNLKRLRQTFGTKDIQKLIFDERPYKYYMVKLESPIELSYVCFDESYNVETINGIPYKENGIVKTSHDVIRPNGKTRRVYKGEGKISFKAYFPFARSVYKELPYVYILTTDTEIDSSKKYFTYDSTTYKYSRVSSPVLDDISSYYERINKKETDDWALSSGILSINQHEDMDVYDNGSIIVYNPGDIATGFRLYIPKEILSTATIINYKMDNVNTVATLALKPISNTDIKTGDKGVLIDTNNGLVVGVSTVPIFVPATGEYEYTTSGNLYNQYVEAGYFFKIEPTVPGSHSTIQIEGGGEGIQIFYDYLYF